ncbi:unnamed protein product [Diplocarpon coronariae]
MPRYLSALEQHSPSDIEELDCALPVGPRQRLPEPLHGDSAGVWVSAPLRCYRQEQCVSIHRRIPERWRD